MRRGLFALRACVFQIWVPYPREAALAVFGPTAQHALEVS